MDAVISGQPTDLIATIDHVLARSAYDYIIIGGGTAGSLLANRLSENEKTTVLVLEAGRLHDKDDLIDKPNRYVDQLGGLSHDWNFETVPQAGLNNRTVSWNRGKGLGGSSNLNFMQWTRPTKVDIQNWERLGNPGWTWDNLLPYFKKSEKFHEESKSHLTSAHQPLDPSWFGKNGEISLSYAESNPTGIPEVRKVFERFNIPSINHSFSGNNLGLITPIHSVEPEAKTRASSYTSFLRPILARPNLDVLTGATVTRLVIQEKLHHNPKTLFASAVEFVYGEQTYHIGVKHEAILCAGTIKSPHILELSGIGDQKILSKAGIDVKLHLPGVGENLQDHTYIGCLSFEIKDDPPRIPHASSQPDHPSHLHTCALAWVPFQTITKDAEGIISRLIPKHTQESTSPGSGVSKNTSSTTEEQHRLLAESLSNPSVPACEILISHKFKGFINPREAGKDYLSFAMGGIYPWSRGWVHTRSNDPFESPQIEPRYFEQKIDLEILLEGVKFLRKLKDNPDMASIIAKEINPGPTVTTDEDLRDHIRQNLMAFFHATGTLAMLPREKGGVVDPTLKVWGTDNIRVADLSIVPMIVSVHTQSTAYVIAEVAADIICGKIQKLEY